MRASSFISCIAGLICSKIWHDTLRVFILTYMPLCSRELLETYLRYNADGILLGGIMAGLITDSLTPKKVFPFAMLSLSLISGLLIFLFESPAFDVLNARNIFIFLRGIFIAIGMNCAYVAVGNLYRGDPFLPTASNYLYTGFYGILALVPFLMTALPTKPTFVGLVIITFILALILNKTIQKTSAKAVDIAHYFSSWPTLVKRPDFLLCCFVSMVGIGGFYNLIYIFTDAALHNDFIGNIHTLQGSGRQCTFAILMIIFLCKIRISKNNCAQVMSIGILSVSLCAMFLLYLHIGIPNVKLNWISACLFFITCICTGFTQPAAKAAIISIAQGINPNITGSAQSFVTGFNTIIERLGVSLILACPYPGGARIYLTLLSAITILTGLGIFGMRKKINSALK